MEKVIVCRKCGQPAHLIQNQPDHPAMQSSVLVTCWVKMCGNWGLTTDCRDTELFNSRFTFQEPDATQDDEFALDVLQWRAESLNRVQRLGR